MKEDKELQKKIQKEFETPDVPFEEWAAKRGIFTDAANTADCPIFEPAENVSGRSISNGSRKKIFSISVPIIAFFIALTVILLSVFLRPVAPRIYGGNDTVNREIELREISNQEEIYLFDAS